MGKRVIHALSYGGIHHEAFMADLSGWIILDGRSGTFFPAEDATLIDTSRLTSEELQDLEEGTDTDRLLLAEKHGGALRPDCPL